RITKGQLIHIFQFNIRVIQSDHVSRDLFRGSLWALLKRVCANEPIVAQPTVDAFNQLLT
ncbi:hypothetical protein FHW13_003671, partial [Dokdonella fugitiva]|nr:hypothetical protein [Dokdonella fugitiva]